MKYLALGDSYTIGELVPSNQNFPNQVVSLLQEKGKDCRLDKLIAVTGWTTDELAIAIEKDRPAFDYDIVTLLIGVNNQYRERSLEEYRWQFYTLLCQAILFANGNPKHVIVLSIPDWGLTPFNTSRDSQLTSAQIDAFNAINRSITFDLGCNYIDVTNSSREHATDKNFLAEDLLHYSATEYTIWAKKVVETILSWKA